MADLIICYGKEKEGVSILLYGRSHSVWPDDLNFEECLVYYVELEV